MSDQLTDSETKALQRAAQALPPKTRMALLLVNEGRSYEEISAELKVNARTARRLVERAMVHLVERLARSS